MSFEQTIPDDAEAILSPAGGGRPPLPVRDPRTGRIDAVIHPSSSENLAGLALTLRQNQVEWAARGFAGRLETLDRFAAELAARRDALTAALERDTGRRRIAGIEADVLGGMIAGVRAAAASFGQADWSQGRSVPHIRHRPQWVPYSLVGVISPWNFPFLLSMIDALPALAAGCAVMVKPSEVTPRFVAPVMQAIAATPGLSDVFAFVVGDGATGQAVVDLADCICFTGSVATGRKVAVQAAGRLIPAFLELGGKDPLVVLAGADLEAATDAAIRGCVLSTGQACQSIERIYVDRALHDAFLARLVQKAEAVRLNGPDIATGDIGPVIFEKQAVILQAQIDDARDRGARILTGGRIETIDGGLYLRPTVIADATHDMLAMRDETFGPLLPVMAFDAEDEAVRLANDSDYGLSGAVFGPDLDAAARVGERLDCGAVSLNDAALTTLFHEAGKQSFKASGLGPSRMGADGLARFLRRKALIANTARPLPLQAFSEDA
ncbi:MAG: aldehyde dehydrogenase family protein [Brevundimonas sp.]|uniref:aldehyde dehydrogenase family protein n=1 Tax=Brevundimonas sp. TaxID=1871086 RepID=UPI0025C73BE9|nr:aldehyde dehydrogenase family protein [Brevundimonas sp.]MBX3478452.1 aldehyde dehydrogenase family protein [Brevundimonas sp.]